MWLRVTGNIETGIKYQCIPKDEYEALKARHDKLKEYLKHKKNCDIHLTYYQNEITGRPSRCTCGLEQALKESEGE